MPAVKPVSIGLTAGLTTTWMAANGLLATITSMSAGTVVAPVLATMRGWLTFWQASSSMPVQMLLDKLQHAASLGLIAPFQLPALRSVTGGTGWALFIWDIRALLQQIGAVQLSRCMRPAPAWLLPLLGLAASPQPR